MPYIREMKDAAQFYANRVVKEWKDKYVEWLGYNGALH